MLAAAGVEFDVVPSEVDERKIKANFTGGEGSLAQTLAEAKAVEVSERSDPSNWVIGSDSLVSVGGRRFSKPRDRNEAEEHLRTFSEKTMVLTSAVALARGGRCEWKSPSRAELRVRDLSDGFISDYLDAEWPEVGYTVGVFRLEGRGVQLFSAIKGDYFTILGMPLIPLLSALRERGLLQS